MSAQTRGFVFGVAVGFAVCHIYNQNKRATVAG